MQFKEPASIDKEMSLTDNHIVKIIKDLATFFNNSHIKSNPSTIIIYIIIIIISPLLESNNERVNLRGLIDAGSDRLTNVREGIEEKALKSKNGCWEKMEIME